MQSFLAPRSSLLHRSPFASKSRSATTRKRRSKRPEIFVSRAVDQTIQSIHTTGCRRAVETVRALVGVSEFVPNNKSWVFLSCSLGFASSSFASRCLSSSSSSSSSQLQLQGRDPPPPARHLIPLAPRRRRRRSTCFRPSAPVVLLPGPRSPPRHHEVRLVPPRRPRLRRGGRHRRC